MIRAFQDPSFATSLIVITDDMQTPLRVSHEDAMRLVDILTEMNESLNVTSKIQDLEGLRDHHEDDPMLVYLLDAEIERLQFPNKDEFKTRDGKTHTVVMNDECYEQWCSLKAFTEADM